MTEMVWTYVLRAADRQTFKRCRRAWDLGSRARQNYEPLQPLRVFDFERAIHQALAVYYFPGMWAWDRAIVVPLARKGFFDSMDRQRARYIKEHPLSVEAEQGWQEHLELGEAMLNRYFAWAAMVDRFEPIRVEPEFDVNLPDPRQPGQELVVAGSTSLVPIRYRERIDMLVADGYDAYWIVDHRLAGETWADLDQLLLDEQGFTACWAWQNYFLGMKIAGVIYNELRLAGPDQSPDPIEPRRSVSPDPEAKPDSTPLAQNRRMYMQAVREPDQHIIQHGNTFFRRTQIPRSQIELDKLGQQLALEAVEMTTPELPLYPNPTWENCAGCAYRQPCLAMYTGDDAGAILETSYRKRGEAEDEVGRLGGSTWSMNRGAMPPKFG